MDEITCKIKMEELVAKHMNARTDAKYWHMRFMAVAKEMNRLREHILELEERLLDTDKITTREIARLKRDAAWRMDLVPLAIKVAEHRRARILELEDQLVDAKLELRLKDVQNQM